MAKLTCWILAITLLCSWCWPGNGFDRMRKYRSMGVHEKNAGQIALFLLAVAVVIIGKTLDKEYKCPVYCDVKHAHYYWEKDEENHEQESNLQAVNAIHSPVGDTGKEQPAGSL